MYYIPTYLRQRAGSSEPGKPTKRNDGQFEVARSAPVQNNQKLAFDENCLERLNGGGQFL